MQTEPPPPSFLFDRLEPEDAKLTYPALWRTAAEALPHLGEPDLAVVVSLAADTCHDCFSQHSGCRCGPRDVARLEIVG